MSGRPLPFTKAAIVRAVEATQSAGLDIAGVKVTREGFELVIGTPLDTPVERPVGELLEAWEP